ncbi:hypothetical protein [Terriglobus tenax]|uniref:hypothetical protein n=1 Tax=Terriglobus tenax TaxID=1111115 RepID=UPI0021E00C4F|nr:hypothetical protein [Terriglobus tenax]
MFLPRKSIASTAAALLLCGALAGCKSAEEKAIDQATQQAAATGQAQQVVTNDGKGNVTTTTVTPPDPTTHKPTITKTTVSNPATAGTSTTAAAPGTEQAGPGSAVPDPAKPIIKPADVQIPAGTAVAIRINQHISVKTTPAGSRFSGEIAEPISVNDRVIVPRGTPVSGVVEASKKRGHFKGSSILQLRLTGMTLNGTEYPLETGTFTRTKKGKGKRSAGWIGGTTGAGMLIGGLATGGTGLLIGGLAGAGAGTAVAGLTGNGDIDLPAESLVHFKLSDDLSVVPPAANGTRTSASLQ